MQRSETGKGQFVELKAPKVAAIQTPVERCMVYRGAVGVCSPSSLELLERFHQEDIAWALKQKEAAE